MLTCFPCFNTKGLLKEIRSQIKDVSLKAVKVQHRVKKKQAPKEATILEAIRKEKEEKEEEEEEEEWVAEDEPGVLLTLVALPNGGNLIKRIRFREELFDAWEAQRWWRDNCDRVIDLYSICQSTSASTPSQSNQEHPTAPNEAQEHNEPSNTSYNSNISSPPPTPNPDNKILQEEEEGEEVEEEEQSSMAWTESVIEHEPGVFLTIHSFPDGSKELTRVELSSKRFGQVKARVWWAENKAKLQEQYSRRR